jgi:hypothetical protein
MSINADPTLRRNLIFIIENQRFKNFPCGEIWNIMEYYGTKPVIPHFCIMSFNSAGYARSYASAAVELNSSVFWVITRRQVV